jgi:hypothetical protein
MGAVAIFFNCKNVIISPSVSAVQQLTFHRAIFAQQSIQDQGWNCKETEIQVLREQITQRTRLL